MGRPTGTPRLGARPGRSPDSACPVGFEFLEPDERRVNVLGPIDRLDRRQDRLAVLPRNKRQAVPDQVHDAGLHDGLREH